MTLLFEPKYDGDCKSRWEVGVYNGILTSAKGLFKALCASACAAKKVIHCIYLDSNVCIIST